MCSQLKTDGAGKQCNIHLCDGPHSLGAPLPEHQPLVAVQVLGRFDEAEVN